MKTLSIFNEFLKFSINWYVTVGLNRKTLKWILRFDIECCLDILSCIEIRIVGVLMDCQCKLYYNKAIDHFLSICFCLSIEEFCWSILYPYRCLRNGTNSIEIKFFDVEWVDDHLD